MPDVTSYLANGEATLGQYSRGGYFFYATDRRLITFRKGNFSDVAYKHITTINYEGHIRRGLLALGLLLFFLGLVFSVELAALAATIAGLGIIVVILAIVMKVRRYKIRTSGGEDLPFPVGKQSDAETFLKIVRERMYERQT